MLGNNEKEMMWKEEVVAHFVALRVCLRDWRNTMKCDIRTAMAPTQNSGVTVSTGRTCSSAGKRVGRLG
jgi:hypothetical protein